MTPLGNIRAVAVVALATIAGQALANQPSGTVVAVVQQASIDGQSGLLVLQVEAPVYSGDRIQTDANGQAQIRFRDDTRLVVGPNSSMVIDAFVFDGSGAAREISINAVRGAFRFITGNSNKDAYRITTPTATIGMRGTEFDVAIEGATGVTRVVNFEGVVRICRRRPDGTLIDPREACVDTRDPCTLSIAGTKQPVIRYTADDVALRARQLKAYFPYVRSQESLLADFQVDVDQCLSPDLPPASKEPAPVPPPPPGPGPVPPTPVPSPAPDLTPPSPPVPLFRKDVPPP